MPLVCSICSHEHRLEIDRLLVQGKSHQTIAKRYNVSPQAVFRHHQNHLSRQLIQHAQKKEFLGAVDILSDIEDLIKRTKNILDLAESKNQYGLALKAIAESRSSYELLSKIAFALHQARLSELELERLKSGETATAESEAFRDDLKILTDGELQILLLIQNKIESGNPKIDVLKEFALQQNEQIIISESKPLKRLKRLNNENNDFQTDLTNIGFTKDELNLDLESLKVHSIGSTLIDYEKRRSVVIKKRTQ